MSRTAARTGLEAFLDSTVTATRAEFRDPLLEHDGYVEALEDRTFTSGFPIVRIEYTDEAIRAMCRAERRVIHETRGEIHDRFDSS